MENLKNKCNRLQVFETLDKRNKEARNNTIYENLKTLGCDFCSGNYTECKSFLPNYEVYSNRGCLR